MGSYRIAQQQRACSIWARGSIPKDFLEFVHSDIPVLIFSGEYDPVTAVSMAKEIAQHLSNSQHIIIPEMSHMFDGLSNEECFDNMAVEFINSNGKAKVKTDCITTMKPPAYKVKK